MGDWRGHQRVRGAANDIAERGLDGLPHARVEKFLECALDFWAPFDYVNAEDTGRYGHQEH
jgi:hypothetical protein